MSDGDPPQELLDLLAAMRAEHAHPLVAAARAGDLATVERELPAADADYCGLALEDAAGAGALAVVERLLEAGVPVHGPPIQRAIFHRAYPVLRRLLAANPDEEARGTALVSLLLEDDHEALDCFLEADALPADAHDLVRRLGSNGMRKRFGIRARPKRR